MPSHKHDVMERSSASHALRLTTPCVLLEGYTNDPFSMPGLRKLVGYLKTTAEFCMMLEMPVAGQGKLKASERYWILENYSDSDWSGHQAHRRSTSCGLHNCCQHGFVHGTAYFFSGTQKVRTISWKIQVCAYH